MGLALAMAAPAEAQSDNPFAVAVKVNDRVVTNYEIAQRILLLKAFGTTGDVETIAREQLINERLQLDAARQLGMSVNEEDIAGGVDEFAARGGLNGEQLYQYVASRGADGAALQDFVEAGLLWRNVVQARFAQRAAVSEDEIDRNLALATGQTVEEVLISEIQIPLRESGNEQTMELITDLSRTITTTGEFASAARRYSRAPSRGRGGRVNWLPVSSLPAQLAGQLLALQPGEVTAPITLAETVAIFQLRDVRQVKGSGQTVETVNFTQVVVPSNGRADDRDRATAQSVVNNVDNCDDLRAESERFGDRPFTDHTAQTTDVPDAVAVALARLDRNEATYYTTEAGTVAVIMVCDRLTDLPEGARENLRNALFNRRMAGFGQGYLQELRGDAEIIER